MKKISILFLFIINTYPIYSATTTGTLSATVIPISLTDFTVTQGFDFPGIIIRGIAGSVILNYNGQMESTGVGLSANIGIPAELKLATEADTQISLTIPASSNLYYSDTSLSPITLTNITCAYRYSVTDVLQPITSEIFTSGPNGSTNLTCGAQLNIPANSSAGDVNGTVLIGIAY